MVFAAKIKFKSMVSKNVILRFILRRPYHVFFGLYYFVKRFLWKVLYFNVRQGRGCYIDIQGSFHAGKDVSVMDNCVIVAPRNSRVYLSDESCIMSRSRLYPNNIFIGKNTSVQVNCCLIGDIHIGDHVLLAPNVYISSGRHHFSFDPYLFIKDQDSIFLSDEVLRVKHSKKVIIEDDVWIGINSVIMPGVKVGKGCVIGANSVVTKDVYPYSVVAGSPAKIIKKRLSFVPPKKISFDNAREIIYFYSGFDISESEKKQNLGYGGYVARRSFVICLDATAASEIVIVAKCIYNDKLSISYLGNLRKVSDIYAEISFPINSDGVSYFQFCLKSLDKIKESYGVAIRSAFVR